ncbi:MAG: type II toxin-antitoxin system HicA family toxin [Candidatus Omnitrophica bacterium]|nr:type II toxin-antitoxin system HicA family toxin [Candidatus Omnitrophota bacterium]
MSKLPTDISGATAVKAFVRSGWIVRKYGPHIILEKAGVRPILSVPNHRILKPGTLRALLRTASISLEDFLRLL